MTIFNFSLTYSATLLGYAQAHWVEEQMRHATLLTKLELKSKIVSHERFMELMLADDISVLEISIKDKKQLQVVLRSSFVPALHPSYIELGGSAMRFLGLGIVGSDDCVWLYQWKAVVLTEILPENQYSPLPKELVTDFMERHRADFMKQLETSL